MYKHPTLIVIIMGRKSFPRKTNCPKKQKTPNIEELLLNPNTLDNYNESRYSPDSLRNLRKELKDAITKIYSKYILRFIQIKEIRLSLQDPIVAIQSEELVIEKNYCNELTQKVKQLVHLDSLTDIYYTFCKSVVYFMSQVNKELQGLPALPGLQLICLIEAYQVVLNSARELSKVTSGIFENQPSYISCEKVTKLAFLDQVLKNFQHPNVESPLFSQFQTIENDLTELADYVKGLDRQSKNSSKALIPASYEKSLDEIVSFINGKEKKVNRRRMVSKASTAENSGSPFRQRSLEKLWTSMEEGREEKSSSVDKEIKEFQAKLESARPLFQRLKPSLSEEWLKKIKSQIVKNN